jgi:hypothetical protein
MIPSEESKAPAVEWAVVEFNRTEDGRSFWE